MGEIYRAIQRVDEPLAALLTRKRTLFFADDDVSGVALPNFTQQIFFGGQVGFRDKVDCAFIFYVQTLTVISAQDFSGFQGQIFDFFQRWGHGLVVNSISAARFAK